LEIILISFDALLGKKVIGIGGYIVGEVAGAEIDLTTWHVRQLHVKLSDTAAEELGFKKRFRSSKISMPTKMVRSVGDVVNLWPKLEALSESKEIAECK
jgi:sporulation protein YlmC with PRC-barrel domain